MKITKKMIAQSTYAVFADGRDTLLRISKADAPRWGEPRRWAVERLDPSDTRGTWLFEARGLEDAHVTLQIIANSFTGDFT